jgi:hypothetical protein
MAVRLLFLNVLESTDGGCLSSVALDDSSWESPFPRFPYLPSYLGRATFFFAMRRGEV